MVRIKSKHMIIRREEMAQSMQVQLDCGRSSFELRWSDLSHSYSRQIRKNSGSEDVERVALNLCNGAMKSSPVTAILGPSGAGESTLLNCITGTIEPHSGRCVISGPANLIEDLSKSRVDYVPQSTEHLWPHHSTSCHCTR